jgi:hypothetical protein
MNHELTLELKNAGFPLVACEQLYCDRNWVTLNGDNFHEPTLSELITAVMAHRIGIHHFSLSVHDEWLVYEKVVEDIWRAKYYPYSLGYCEGTGKTPEEAVAKLWLELNKK